MPKRKGIMVEMKRVLLLIPTSSYRAHDFMAAAARLDIEIIIGSNRRQALSRLLPDTSLALNLRKPESSLKKIKQLADRKPLSAVIGVDEETVILAAMANQRLGLPSNSVESVKATRDKYLMRQKMAQAGLPSPKFRAFTIDSDPKQVAGEIDYPVVVKPTFLSASQGVIRANSEREFVEAFEQVAEIITHSTKIKHATEAQYQVLVEDYIPGSEVAVEGIVIEGEFKLLAIFDKPDPLEGPFFTETIYTTPSRYPQEIQNHIIGTTIKALETIGLTTGPIHAEMRINENGVWVVEVAARSIGGLCSRVLRFGDGISLEELILRHAIGEDVRHIEREGQAAGVMMMPAPKPGILKEVKHIEAAKQIPGIENIVITIAQQQRMEPLPYGSKYLGFIFARSDSPDFVEKSIREAYRMLEVVIEGSRC